MDAPRAAPDDSLSGAAAGQVVLSNLDFSYQLGKGARTSERIPVLSGLNLTIERGEFCCIVGPSGSGKSTLLRIIAGLIRADSGGVLIDGRQTKGPRPEISVVFQNFNLLPWRTAEGNVALGLESLRVGKAERHQKALAWLRLVGLEDFAGFYPKQLSGGMQQRVGLARAFAVEPEILLMDEPFGAVDAQTRRLMQIELLKIWSSNQKTVIFVTHDVEEALYLGDRVIVFSPRPARIVHDTEVPFGRPRSDTVRADPRFVRIKEDLWHKLSAPTSLDSDHTSTGHPGL